MVVEKREEALFISAKPQSAGDRYTDTALNGQQSHITKCDRQSFEKTSEFS